MAVDIDRAFLLIYSEQKRVRLSKAHELVLLATECGCLCRTMTTEPRWFPDARACERGKRT